MIPVVMPTYVRADVTFERGDGLYLTATDGRRYLDFGAGVAVNALGHNHPRLVQALTEQVGKLWHVSNLYQAPWQERVARKLVENSFADTVFFCNSGAEAMECCIKMARKYQDSLGKPERNRLLVAGGAFHGRTLATLAAGGQEKHLAGFAPIVQGFDRVPYGNMNALRAAITRETAGVLVEPIQGEGGIVPGAPDYLREIRKACDEFGILMILDEVQTGIGRTGKLFAHQWAGIEPDIVGTAKGLGGGFPVGACLATEKAAKPMTYGTHGSTFGGNPLAMAAAGVVLDEVLSPGFLERVQAVGAYLQQKLAQIVREFPSIFAELRGNGLMLGLRCVPPNGEVGTRLLQHGLITIAAGDNVLRFLPPLIVTEAHVDEAVQLIRGALENWRPS